MDAVFALQRSGADGVFAYQFPVAAVSSGGWGHLPIPEPFRGRSDPAEVPRAVRELEERAAEIADATVARAAAVEAPASLADVMQVWAMPVSLSALVAEPVKPVELLRASSSFSAPPAGLSLAALDEDAILAASMLLMRRRKA